MAPNPVTTNSTPAMQPTPDANQQPTPEDEGALVAARRAKLEQFRATLGIEPYGRRVDDLESAAAARARFDESAHAEFEACQQARKADPAAAIVDRRAGVRIAGAAELLDVVARAARAHGIAREDAVAAGPDLLLPRRQEC